MSAPRGVSAAERRRLAELAAAQEARRRRTWWIVGIVAVVALALVGGTTLYQQWLTRRAPSASAAAADPAPHATVVAGQPLTVGKPGAPHVVALFEDAHCPHCATLEQEIGETLTSGVREGRARLELWPLQIIDDGSARAAAAQACAAEQGRLLSFHAGLWANDRALWTDEQLVDLARATGEEQADAIAKCITSGTHVGWATALQEAADARGIEGTPTVEIDGVHVELRTLTADALDARLR